VGLNPFAGPAPGFYRDTAVWLGSPSGRKLLASLSDSPYLKTDYQTS